MSRLFLVSKSPVLLLVILCICVAGASTAAEPTLLEKQLVNEGFDVDALQAKVHPRLLATLQNNLQKSFDKVTPTPTVRIDVRLRPSDREARNNKNLRTKSGLSLRKAHVKAAQQKVFDRMQGLYGLEELTLRNSYVSFYGFTADADERAVAALAGLEDVIEISLVERLLPDDTEAHALTATAVTQTLAISGIGRTIAVIDTGIDYTHDAFGGYSTFPNAKVLGGYDFANSDNDPMADCTDDYHGTGTASVAAGNGGGVTGSAPNAWLVHLKILDDCNDQYSSISTAVDWIVSNHQAYSIDVVTMSMSSSTELSDYCDNNISSGMQSDLQALIDLNIPFFSSTSNDANKAGIAWPSCSSKIISVGSVYDTDVGKKSYCTDNTCNQILCTDSTTQSDQVPCYSNSAPILDILGPAECYTAAKSGGGTRSCFGGTSTATPYVGGVAASLLQGAPWLTREGLIFALKEGGIPVTDPANGVTKPRVNSFISYANSRVYVPYYLMALNNVGNGEGEVLYRLDYLGALAHDTGALNNAETCASDLVQATDDGKIYAVGCEGIGGGSSFFTIDPINGHTAEIATLWGDETHLTSIAFDATSNTLYGMNMHQQYRGRVLVTIDRATGETTAVGSLWDDRTQATSIAFHEGTLYAINSSGWGMGSVLFEIDKTNARATDISSLSGDYNKASSLRIAPDGTAFGIDWDGSKGGVGKNLFRVNLNTGVTSDLGRLSGDRTKATALTIFQ